LETKINSIKTNNVRVTLINNSKIPKIIRQSLKQSPKYSPSLRMLSMSEISSKQRQRRPKSSNTSKHPNYQL